MKLEKDSKDAKDHLSITRFFFYNQLRKTEVNFVKNYINIYKKKMYLEGSFGSASPVYLRRCYTYNTEAAISFFR